MAIFYLVLAVILFVGLVVIHEWGHFIMARRGGVEVEEFGIGFPPRIWSKPIKTKKSEFLFTINLLPLGGFVRMKGENDADRRKGSFGAAPVWTKVKIMVAGVVMNMIAAVVILFILALVGMPKFIENQFTVASDTKLISTVQNADVVKVGNVNNNTPAQKAGLQSGDEIVSFNGTVINTPDQVGPIARDNAGKEIPITIKRNDQTSTYNVTINAQNTGDGYLGVSSVSGATGREVRRSTWSAPIVALGVTKQFTVATVQGLGNALNSLLHGDRKAAGDQVSGPVGVAYVLNSVSKEGFIYVLMIMSLISISLAIMNILPIPALDGGRLFVMLLFLAIKKPLTKSLEERIHGSGFVALIGLFILITVLDVKRFIL